MELNEKQNSLLDFVKQQHGKQSRKYTGEPYSSHCLSVAEICVSARCYQFVEVALCHDLLEDTECTSEKLMEKLLSLGYHYHYEVIHICRDVEQLTNKYTHEAYPDMNRERRKKEEAKRLSKASYQSQSVKMADIIDNSKSIIKYDPKFARVYMEEARNLFTVLDRANPTLRLNFLSLYFDYKTSKNDSQIKI